jgi:hypothetical protein
VHGGFEGTDTRFAFYFPEAEHYQGRFLQYFEGGAGGHEGKDSHPSEFITSFLGLASSVGGYLVECNTGHIGADHGPDDRTISSYRANAQSARYARQLAEEMYGTAPHHGYIVGGSSGGIRAIFALEHVDDVWDGAVPFVVGPLTTFTVGATMPVPRMGNAGTVMELLRPEARASVLDAVEPGGGDVFAGLNEFEREAITALFEGGFQREALFQYAEDSTLTLIVPIWMMMPMARDLGYFDDFWNVAGYAGADGELADRLIDQTATVSKIHTADELTDAGITDHPLALMGGMGCGLVADDGWPAGSRYADVAVLTGKAAGQTLTAWGTFGDVLVVGGTTALEPGDGVSISNRRFLAAALFFRYQDQRERAIAAGDSTAADAPAPSPFPGPQLPKGQTPGGYLPTGMSGRFHGKMIMFNALLDVMAPTGGAVLYDAMVREAVGGGADETYRLWWVDNSCHTGLPFGASGGRDPRTYAVMYGGIMQEAARNLIDWIEDGTEPPPSTPYRFEHGQVVLPATAAEREGVQPVATATANGGVRADVEVGTPVTFEVVVEAPPRGGKIIEVAWDFDGSGEYADAHDEVDGSSSSLHLSITHTFDAPGTYFPAVRVVAERDGNVDATLGRMENLDRVRIVVT